MAILNISLSNMVVYRLCSQVKEKKRNKRNGNFFLFSTASIFNLVLLSFDRYWAVVHPLYYLQRRSRKRAIYLLVFIWFISSLWIPAIFFWSFFSPQSINALEPNECDTLFRSNKLFKTLTAFVNFYLPLLTMIAISCRIMIAIRSRSTMEFGRRISSTTQKQRRKKRALTNPLSSERDRATTHVSIVVNPFESVVDKNEQDLKSSPIEIKFPIENAYQRKSEILLRRYSNEILMKNSSTVENNMKYYQREPSSSSISDDFSNVQTNSIKRLSA